MYLAYVFVRLGFKPLYLLNYIDDEDYRRRILTQLNRGESRHAVARAICHGQKGEIRKRYQDGQEEQLGALGLVTNAVVLWNTIYMQAALTHLRDEGEVINEEDEVRLSPLRHAHINISWAVFVRVHGLSSGYHFNRIFIRCGNRCVIFIVYKISRAGESRIQYIIHRPASCAVNVVTDPVGQPFNMCRRLTSRSGERIFSMRR